LSVQTALDNICLRPSARWGHTEYSMNYHKGYVRKKTVLDPEDPRAARAFADAWEFDFNWSVDNGLHADWAARGRATDMGHAVYAADGGDRREAVESPFRTPEEVWAFDPDAEYGLPAFEDQVAAHEKKMRNARRDFPGQTPIGSCRRGAWPKQPDLASHQTMATRTCRLHQCWSGDAANVEAAANVGLP
jgi:hypothetical protein